MEIKSFFEKYRLFLPLTATILILLTTLFVGNLLASEVKISEKRLIEKNQLDYDLTQLDKVLADRKKYEEDFSVLRNSVPDSYNTVAYFANILDEKSSDFSQNMENMFDKNAKEEKNGLSTITLRMSTTGSYNSYANFLSSIANLPYHTQIDSVKIEKGEAGVSALSVIRLYIGKI